MSIAVLQAIGSGYVVTAALDMQPRIGCHTSIYDRHLLPRASRIAPRGSVVEHHFCRGDQTEVCAVAYPSTCTNGLLFSGLGRTHASRGWRARLDNWRVNGERNCRWSAEPDKRDNCVYSCDTPERGYHRTLPK
ncbi:Uncharacterised protein [Mycobacteroides abscessus subsp. abscessus]|nr:Uncharacterised protein [Mycobacteroides abscessus subsp. abscessus]